MTAAARESLVAQELGRTQRQATPSAAECAPPEKPRLLPCAPPGGNSPHVDTLLQFPLDPRVRAFPGRLLPSAGHSWNWQASPPSAEMKGAPDWGGGFCHFSRDSALPALSLLCGGGPQGWPGSDKSVPGRNCGMWSWNYAQGCWERLERDGERTIGQPGLRWGARRRRRKRKA